MAIAILTDNGEARSLVSSGNVENGTMQYALGESTITAAEGRSDTSPAVKMRGPTMCGTGGVRKTTTAWRPSA